MSRSDWKVAFLFGLPLTGLYYWWSTRRRAHAS